MTREIMDKMIQYIFTNHFIEPETDVAGNVDDFDETVASKVEALFLQVGDMNAQAPETFRGLEHIYFQISDEQRHAYYKMKAQQGYWDLDNLDEISNQLFCEGIPTEY